LALTTPFFNRLVRDDRVQEYFIDSTFNTNQQEHELYAVLAGVRGAGFPISYLLLSTQKDVARLKSDAIGVYLRELKQKGLEPKYFFTDKDMAQMRAMRLTWPESAIRLCSWHRRRAVKSKMQA
jgi:hypothetical protein